MTSHELHYFRYLMQRIKDLYIEIAAMSTILDAPQGSKNVARDQWRVVCTKMCEDPVFRSAIEANYGPMFERLKLAMNHEKTLADLEQVPLEASSFTSVEGPS